MSGLESINTIDFSFENIPIIFEKQRKNLKQDILFLKEEILKDFRQIESKLNTKYERQNINTIAKLRKFETTIESMNNKILELSDLVSTDKNIKQKLSNLLEFKLKVSDSLLSQDLAIKSNESMIKEAIDRYDKLFSESILYPGIVGNNCQFKNFHNFIDFAITNINQFINFKEKYLIDFKGNKIKFESLFKTLKVQIDSIVTTNNRYVDEKIKESHKIIKELMNVEQAKILQLKTENNKIGSSLQNKIDEINNDIKYIKETKINISERIEQEINSIKNFNKGITNNFENFENEINSIKDDCNNLAELIQNMKKNSNFLSDSIIDLKKTCRLMSQNSNDFIKSANNNYNRYVRRGTIAKSIIKQYISGEININEIDNSPKRQKSTFFNVNEMKSLINNVNNNNQSNNISRIKRMTFGPEKFMNLHKLDKSVFNKFIENSDKSNNSISEEKSEDIDYINSYKEQKKDDNNMIEDKISTIIYEEVDNKNYNINEIKPLDKISEIINKNNIKDGKNITLLNNSKKRTKVNFSPKIRDMKNYNDHKDEIKKQNKNINYIKNEIIENQKNSSRGNTRSISYEKVNIEKCNSFPKYTNKNLSFKKEYTMNNRKKQFSAVGKLSNIGGNIDIISNNSNSNTNKNELNKTSILFNNEKKMNININDYHNYNEIKKRMSRKRLNIIEVNFDEGNELVKEEDELKALIKKIKENRINVRSERNYRPLHKNKVYKRLSISDFDAGLTNNSTNGALMNNNSNNYYLYNKKIKDELPKYYSLGYFNYIKNNKKGLNMQKMIHNNEKNLSGNFPY